MHPGRQRLARVVSVALDMDGQHSLLNQIFRLRRTSADARELALVIGTQTAAQLIEQRAVRRRIAVQSRKHHPSKLSFCGRHACVSLLVRRSDGFGYSPRLSGRKNPETCEPGFPGNLT